MNQFRDLLIVAMIVLAIALAVGQPENWNWIKLGGTYAVQALFFLVDFRPWSIIILFRAGPGVVHDAVEVLSPVIAPIVQLRMTESG